MNLVWPVAVIVLDYLIKQVIEAVVRAGAASIYSNTRICVFTTGEDGSLERVIEIVRRVFVFVPHFPCQMFSQLTFCSRREDGETSYFVRVSKVISHFAILCRLRLAALLSRFSRLWPICLRILDLLRQLRGWLSLELRLRSLRRSALKRLASSRWASSLLLLNCNISSCSLEFLEVLPIL